MHVKIYYLSTTGNTRSYLQQVKKGLTQNGHSCEIIDIIKTKAREIEDDADLYGFACPTFSFREPTAMKRFLKGIKGKQKRAAFIFTSMEADSGRLHVRMKKRLNKKGFFIIDYMELNAPLNYTPILSYNPGVITESYLKMAYSFGLRLMNSYNDVFIEKTSEEPRAETRFVDRLKVLFANDLTIKLYTGKIKLDKDKCIKCGQCGIICPDEAIKYSPYPRIKWRKCTGCCACINNCPENALDSKRTKSKIHYKCSL